MLLFQTKWHQIRVLYVWTIIYSSECLDAEFELFLFERDIYTPHTDTVQRDRAVRVCNAAPYGRETDLTEPVAEQPVAGHGNVNV